MNLFHISPLQVFEKHLLEEADYGLNEGRFSQQNAVMSLMLSFNLSVRFITMFSDMNLSGNTSAVTDQ